MYKHECKFLLTILTSIKQDGPVEEVCGICGQIEAWLHKHGGYDQGFVNAAREWIRVSAIQWDEYSGSVTYPVKSGDGRTPANKFMTTGDMWDDSPYGKARKQLLDWLIQRLESIKAP